MTEIEKPAPERKIWGPWATVGFGLVIIAVFFIIQILVSVVFFIVNIPSYFDSSTGPPQLDELLNAIETMLATQEGLITSITALVTTVICVGLIIVFARIRKGVSIAEYLGLKQITGKQILAVLAIMAGFIILSDCLSLLLGRPLYPEQMVSLYRTSVWPALLWVSLIIFVPIFEETLFRGFVFEGFWQSRLGPVGAVGLTALAWASLHIQYDFYNIAVIFVLGILLGIVRIKTGSLWSTLIMHAFANLVALIEVALNLNRLVG
jgi:membrane protease YdiL (CAAX protease family)